MAVPDKFRMCVSNLASEFTLTSSRTVDSDYPITNLQSSQSGKFAAFDMTAQTALNIYGTDSAGWDIDCISLHNHTISNGSWRVRLYADESRAGELLYDSGSAYALFDGTNDSSTTPDSSINGITGDMTIISCISANDYTSSVQTIVSKWDGASNKSFTLRIDSDGSISIHTSTSGTSTDSITAINTISGLVSDGNSIWLKIVFTANNGAGGRTMTGYYSTQPSDEEVNNIVWTLWDSKTVAAPVAIFDSSAALDIAVLEPSTQQFSGKVYRCLIFSDITATTLVSDFDPRRWTSGSTFGSSVSGETWTLNNGASVVATGTTIDYPYATANNWKSNLSMWFDAVTAKSFQVDVTVSSTIGNQILIDKLFVGESFTLTHNADYGSSVLMDDTSQMLTKADGGVMTVSRPAIRKANFDFSLIDNSERETVRDYLRLAKKSGDVLVTLDPNDTQGFKEDSTSVYRVDSSRALMPTAMNLNPLKISLIEN